MQLEVKICYLFEHFILYDMCIRVLCLIIVPLPPGKTPFAAQINNNNNKVIIFKPTIFVFYRYFSN
jgi:hypothetical protein